MPPFTERKMRPNRVSSSHRVTQRQAASLGHSPEPSAALPQDILFSDEAGLSVCRCGSRMEGGS